MPHVRDGTSSAFNAASGFAIGTLDTAYVPALGDVNGDGFVDMERREQCRERLCKWVLVHMEAYCCRCSARARRRRSGIEYFHAGTNNNPVAMHGPIRSPAKRAIPSLFHFAIKTIREGL